MENNEEKSPGEMLDMMMKGAFDGAEITEAIPDEGAEDVNELDSDLMNANNEDTENTDTVDEPTAEDTDTKDENDDSQPDTGDSEVDDGIVKDSENTPVEGDKQDDAETKTDPDGDESDTAEVDYKKLYDETQVQREFYDKVTSKFIANGKEVQGYTDPNKVIQAQQAMYGLDKKYAMLKQFRPFQSPLEKRGMLTDTSKFDLAMSIMDGDKEAIKKHLKDLNIDPVMDLDIEDVKYEPTPQTTSEVELSLMDVMDNAANAGVKDEAERVLYKDWDEDSVYRLLQSPEARRDLIEHLKPNASGERIYDVVQARVAEKAALEPMGEYAGMNAIDKYKIAAIELEREYVAENPQSNNNNNNTMSASDIVAKAKQAEADRLAKAEANAVEKYKASIAKKNNSADAGRRNAASISKPKNNVATTTKKVDPMNLTGESFMDYWHTLEKAGL